MQSMPSTQAMKLNARHYLSVASDKARLASANVGRGETMELDIAIIKATTSQFHVQPKEKHVRTLKSAVTPAQPRRQVAYVISELVKRLKEATDWLTVLKCLMVFHRLMRESDLTFLEELLKYSEEVTRGKAKQILNMDNFIDTANSEGRFEFSEWVRAYGKYLDEQLEVYGQMNYYQEQDSRMRNLEGKQMLTQLPILQHLMQRLVDCKPTGQATHDPVVQASLMLVLTESFKIYKAISEGLINLADRFFEMEYLDAVKGLEVYKETLVANQRLQEYYHAIESIEDMRRAIQFPKLEPPPADFLRQMEEYCHEAPRPIDPKHPGDKKKSPPLRKGRNAAPGPRRERAHPEASSPSADPGMVLAFNQVASQPLAQPQNNADLLDLDAMTLSSPTHAAGQQPASNGNSAALDLLGDLQAPQAAPPPSHEERDPFGADDSFGSAFNQAPSSGSNPYAQPAHSSQPPPQQFGGSGFGQQPSTQFHSPPHFAQHPPPQSGTNPFQGGGPGGFGAAQPSYQGPPASYHSGGANSFQPPGQAAPPPQGPGAAAPASGPRNTAGPALKKMAAADDPFGDLTGLKPSSAPKYNPPLKAQPAAGSAPSQGIAAHVPSANFSGGAGAGAGGFGQPYAAQQTFNPSSFDQDAGFGGGAFAATKQGSPAKSHAAHDPFALAGNGNSLI